jgi:hypothetical protein
MLVKKSSENMYYILLCVLTISDLSTGLHAASFQQKSNNKRKFTETSLDEKARVAWQACRLEDVTDKSIVGDEFDPGFRTTVKGYLEELFPSVLADIIIKYGVRYGLCATAQQWDLSLLSKKLNIQFEEYLGSYSGLFACFGLVACSRGNLWLAAKNKDGRFSTYTRFRIPLDSQDTISASLVNLNLQFFQENNKLCSSGVLVCSADNKLNLVSLKNGRTIALCQSPDDSWKVHRLWGITKDLMIGSLTSTCSEKSYKISVINRNTGTYINLPIDFEGGQESGPEHIVLGRPSGAKYPWIVLFYKNREKESQVVDTYGSSTGRRMGCFSYPDKNDFLHMHEDDSSIMTLDQRLDHSFLLRYELPTGRLISRTTLGVTPCQHIFNDVVWKARNKNWDPSIMAAHPSFGTTLHLPFGSQEQFEILQSISDKQGKYLAAIIRTYESFISKLRLIVWNVTSA